MTLKYIVFKTLESTENCVLSGKWSGERNSEINRRRLGYRKSSPIPPLPHLDPFSKTVLALLIQKKKSKQGGSTPKDLFSSEIKIKKKSFKAKICEILLIGS